MFSLSSPRRSDECSHAMRLGARERGWLPPRTPPHIPPSNAISRDRGRKLRESLHLGGDFLFKKQDEDASFARKFAFLAQERLVASSPPFPFPVQSSRIVNILQIVLYLTTILTTINRQQKSILPQRTCKKCATQPASTSGDPSDAFASSSFDFKKPISCFSPRKERRPARFSATFSVGSRKSSLPADVSHVSKLYEPRTAIASHSLALIHKSHNKMPFDFFVFRA